MSGPRLTFLLLALLALQGCAGPGWYAQAVSGHYRLMGDRENIAELLRSGDLDPEWAARLEKAMEMRAFAQIHLGLETGKSYQQFVMTGRDAVSWNVVAAPEFSLQPRRWCFLVSGCVPYRGYFDPEDARRFAGRMADKGFDVTVSPAIAYSTLGWFQDPLLDTMFRYDDARLAAFLFHELAHSQLYVRGDTAFSEAYASFVEEAGVTEWLTHSHQEATIGAWRAREDAGRDFAGLLREIREELQDVYDSPAPADRKRAEKAKRFDALESRYRRLVDGPWEGKDYYSGWFSSGPNNAQMALAQSYLGGVCVFRALFASAGGDWSRFHELAADKARLDKTARRQWLQQPCPDIASGNDL